MTGDGLRNRAEKHSAVANQEDEQARTQETKAIVLKLAFIVHRYDGQVRRGTLYQGYVVRAMASAGPEQQVPLISVRVYCCGEEARALGFHKWAITGYSGEIHATMVSLYRCRA